MLLIIECKYAILDMHSRGDKVNLLSSKDDDKMYEDYELVTVRLRFLIKMLVEFFTSVFHNSGFEQV